MITVAKYFGGCGVCGYQIRPGQLITTRGVTLPRHALCEPQNQLKGLACSACGAPATVVARDVLRHRVRGREFFTLDAQQKRGCALHPVAGTIRDLKGGRMMSACLLVAGVLQCLTMSAPPPTPAQALAILAPGQYVAPQPSVAGPTVTIAASSATAGPFGEFPAWTPPRPLNQTPGAYCPIVTWVGPRIYTGLDNLYRPGQFPRGRR